MTATDTPALGDLKVFYIPQMPMKAFEVKVTSIAEGGRILDVIEQFSAFEFENRVKPDYCDMGGLVRYETDGEDGFDWYDVEDHEVDGGDDA